MMPLLLKPIILTDKSRLKEIYQLRVFAWENSENSRFVNSRVFPDGWKDDFDDSATHWIIEADNRIIASARVYVANVKDNVMANRYETIVPCAFLSRLVVHPDHRKQGITHLMDNARLQFLKDENMARFVNVYVNRERILAFLRFGFIYTGKVTHQYSPDAEVDTSYQLTLKLADLKISE